MSNLTDSIYFTLLSDGRSAEDATKTANSAFNILKANCYQSVPIICRNRYEGRLPGKACHKKLRGSFGNRRYYPLKSI